MTLLVKLITPKNLILTTLKQTAYQERNKALEDTPPNFILFYFSSSGTFPHKMKFSFIPNTQKRKERLRSNGNSAIPLAKSPTRQTHRRDGDWRGVGLKREINSFFCVCVCVFYNKIDTSQPIFLVSHLIHQSHDRSHCYLRLQTHPQQTSKKNSNFKS